ncbi:ribosomal protein S11, partial (mitochondrion) [Klebsormidium nitens]
IANVQNTLNNTIITITDRFGNTKVWCSSGSIGLKASRRSTNYAAQSVAEAVAKKCRKLGIRRVEVRVQGVGYGKPSALKGLRIGGLQIKRIVDTTPKPHNGCRAPKKRRV